MMTVEELWRAVRNHPLCDREIPLEAALSYPVLAQQNGATLLRFFFFLVTRGQGPGAARVQPPFARLTVTLPPLRIVEFVDRSWQNPFPGLPETGLLDGLRHPALQALAPMELIARRNEFFAAYDAILPLFPAPVAAAQKAALAHFRQLFELMLQPALRPYYEHLSPEFFVWLKQ